MIDTISLMEMGADEQMQALREERIQIGFLEVLRATAPEAPRTRRRG
jgi:hypothetical protein